MHAASFHTRKVARVLAAEKGELRSKTITNDGARLEMSDSRASDVGPNFMARQRGAQQVRASGLSAGTAAQPSEVRNCKPSRRSQLDRAGSSLLWWQPRYRKSVS